MYRLVQEPKVKSAAFSRAVFSSQVVKSCRYVTWATRQLSPKEKKENIPGRLHYLSLIGGFLSLRRNGRLRYGRTWLNRRFLPQLALESRIHVFSVSPRQHSTGHRPTLPFLYSLTETVLPCPLLSLSSQQQVLRPVILDFSGNAHRKQWVHIRTCLVKCCYTCLSSIDRAQQHLPSQAMNTPSEHGRALSYGGPALGRPTWQHGR